MDFPSPILIFVLFAGLLAAFGIAGFIAERRRREALAAAAADLRMNFLPDHDRELAARFAWLDALAHGSNRYAHNVVSGPWRGYDVLSFDYHYQVTHHSNKGTRTTHHHIAVHSLTLPRPFPELRILPEDFFSKIAQAVGWEDIDFESAEFSRAFTVRSKDRKFAYDICHPRMMEFLLAHRDLRIEIEGAALAVWSQGRLDPKRIAAGLERLAALRDLMPHYLFTRDSAHA